MFEVRAKWNKKPKKKTSYITLLGTVQRFQNCFFIPLAGFDFDIFLRVCGTSHKCNVKQNIK